MSDSIDIDTIVAEINAPYSGKLPEQAIRAAQKMPREFTPRLITLLENATVKAGRGEQPDGDGHLIALFLLAEFRAVEALPAIVRAISLPGMRSYDLLGDALTEDLGRMLATLAADSIETIDGLVTAPAENEFVQSQAATAYFYLVRDQRMSRDEAMGRLREYLQAAIANRDYHNVTSAVFELEHYGPVEAQDEIREAFQLNLVEELFICLEDLEQSIAEGASRLSQEFERRKPTQIEDTVEYLQTWGCFSKPPTSKIVSAEQREDLPKVPHFNLSNPASEQIMAMSDAELGAAFQSTLREMAAPHTSDVATTFRNEGRRVGRNDSCPCGSGKKFKKCCGSR